VLRAHVEDELLDLALFGVDGWELVSGGLANLPELGVGFQR
jgi:hypothetical protein